MKAFAYSRWQHAVGSIIHFAFFLYVCGLFTKHHLKTEDVVGTMLNLAYIKPWVAPQHCIKWAHDCHPNIWEVEAGASEVQGYPYYLATLKKRWNTGSVKNTPNQTN